MRVADLVKRIDRLDRGGGEVKFLAFCTLGQVDCMYPIPYRAQVDPELLARARAYAERIAAGQPAAMGPIVFNAAEVTP